MPMSVKLPANNSSAVEEDVKLFKYDFSTHSQTKQFLILGGGVFFFYLLHGLLQEDLFKLHGVEPHIWYANSIQFLICALCGTCELGLRQELSVRRGSIKAYTVAGLLTVSTVAFGNEACYYLNYPTLIVFKCCKLVPLLICGIIIQRKWYTAWQFLGCSLMTVGLSLFVLADSSVSVHTIDELSGSEFDNSLLKNENGLLLGIGSGNQVGAKAVQLTNMQNVGPAALKSPPVHSPFPHPKGVVLISIAVLSDAALTNVQEHMMSSLRVSCSELVTYTYAIGTAFISLRCILLNGFSDLFISSHFFFSDPSRLLKLVAYGAVSYFGIMCFALLIRTSGSLIAVMVNTCRRAVTVILSFVLYSKPFTIVYAFAGLIVLLGIALNVREEERLKADKSNKEKEAAESDRVVESLPLPEPTLV